MSSQSFEREQTNVLGPARASNNPPGSYVHRSLPVTGLLCG